MKKNRKMLKKRREHIKERIDKTTNTSKEIKKLSEELYLSESTIEKDYYKSDELNESVKTQTDR